ncbi:MAG: nicotinamide-nucleotide amidohydrolase family protein [Pseudomonadota bacterium]
MQRLMVSAGTAVPDDEGLKELAQHLGETLRSQKLRLAAAESCTGGWIGRVATDVAGSSTWFEGSLVTYSNALKQRWLGVTPEVLTHHGAVSAAVARQMADGACEASGCPVSVAVTGIAGPDGGSETKPVGTVWFGFTVPGNGVTEMCCFAGDREAVRRQTVGHALNRLRELLAPP